MSSGTAFGSSSRSIATPAAIAISIAASCSAGIGSSRPASDLASNSSASAERKRWTRGRNFFFTAGLRCA